MALMKMPTYAGGSYSGGVSIPKLSSTTPQCIYSSEDPSNPICNAFGYDNSKAAVIPNQIGSYIGYDFGRNVILNEVIFKTTYTSGTEFVLQGHDGTQWQPIQTFTATGAAVSSFPTDSQDIWITQTTPYSKYRLYQNTKPTAYGNLAYWGIQFIGETV